MGWGGIVYPGIRFSTRRVLYWDCRDNSRIVGKIKLSEILETGHGKTFSIALSQAS